MMIVRAGECRRHQPDRPGALRIEVSEELTTIGHGEPCRYRNRDRRVGARQQQRLVLRCLERRSGEIDDHAGRCRHTRPATGTPSDSAELRSVTCMTLRAELSPTATGPPSLGDYADR